MLRASGLVTGFWQQGTFRVTIRFRGSKLQSLMFVFSGLESIKVV